MKKNFLFSSNLYFAILCTFVFATLVIKNVFVFTAPSDPLQYVKPALDSNLTFEFFDRVFLWIILKFFSQFITSAHLITGVTHLFITSFTLFICTLWLGNNFGRLSSSVFVFLYILSPVVFGISTYTYPTQLLTLIIIITIITLVNSNSSKRNLYTGLGAVFAFFSKVQSFSFIIFLFFYSFYKNKKFSDFVYLIFGIVCGLLIIVFIFLYYADIYRLLDLIQIYFFEGSGTTQFYGRGEKTMPPFHKYLAEPTILLSIIGMIIPFYYKNLKTLRLFSIVAMVQFLGLFLIYLITKRGGPLIPNYIYDAYILGIICFSGFMFNFSKNKKFDNIIGYFLLLLSVIIIELFSNFNFFTTQQYDPRLLLNWKDISNLNLSYNFFESVIPGIFTWLALFLFFTCSMFRLKVKYTDNIIITSAVLLIIAISLRGGVALEDGKYRKNSALTYHIAAKEIESFNDGSLWVNVELNRNDLKDATLRLKRTFNTFYNSDEYKFFNEKYYFGQNEKLGLLKEYLLTDNVELIHKYLPSQTKEVIKFNSLTDKKPTLASKMNNVQNYPYRLNGIRGEALIYSENDKLIVEPLSKGKEGTFELMLNFANLENFKKNHDQYYFLSTKNIYNYDNTLVTLFINYKNNKKWFSKKKLINNEKDNNSIKFFVPKNVKNISYGWHVTQKEKLSKIILPQIRLHRVSVSNKANPGLTILKIN